MIKDELKNFVSNLLNEANKFERNIKEGMMI